MGLFKHAISVTLQALLLLAMFFAGSVLLPGLNLLPMWRIALSPTRFFVTDGLVLVLLVYGLILLIERLTGRPRPAGLLSTFALLLALALGFAMKFPFMGA